MKSPLKTFQAIIAADETLSIDPDVQGPRPFSTATKTGQPPVPLPAASVKSDAAGSSGSDRKTSIIQSTPGRSAPYGHRMADSESPVSTVLREDTIARLWARRLYFLTLVSCLAALPGVAAWGVATYLLVSSSSANKVYAFLVLGGGWLAIAFGVMLFVQYGRMMRSSVGRRGSRFVFLLSLIYNVLICAGSAVAGFHTVSDIGRSLFGLIPLVGLILGGTAALFSLQGLIAQREAEARR